MTVDALDRLAPVTAPPASGPSRRGVLTRPRALWQRRRAVGLLVTRDLKVRYSSSALGYLWSVLEPLLLAGIYWFIFTQVFTRTVGEEPYVLFLLAGLLPWTWFNAAVTDSARALHTEARLVRSTNVPREVWVLRVVLSKGVEFVFSLPVLLLFALIYAAPVTWGLLYLVPAALLQALLLFGLGLLLSPLVVLVRDLERIVRIGLRLGFYATPVIFAVSDVPGRMADVFALNPLAGIIELNRAGFFPGQLHWAHVGISAAFAAGLLLLGWAVFARLERTVLKEL